jgi:hypothetical protein
MAKRRNEIERTKKVKPTYRYGFTWWEALCYLFAFIDPIPLGIVVGIFMIYYETGRYVAGGKRIIIFSLLWTALVLGWNWSLINRWDLVIYQAVGFVAVAAFLVAYWRGIGFKIMKK